MNRIVRYSTLLFSLTLFGCVSLPDVYLIDRHTVMEAEASGEWPQLDQRFRQEAIKPGPTNLEKEGSNQRKDRVYQVLNGEFTTDRGTLK